MFSGEDHRLIAQGPDRPLPGERRPGGAVMNVGSGVGSGHSHQDSLRELSDCSASVGTAVVENLH